MSKEVNIDPPRKRLEDYIVMGRYVIYVCIFTELMIIPQIGSMFYMVYAGVAPSLKSCTLDNQQTYVFDKELEGKEKCFIFQDMNDENLNKSCTNPQFKYQFKSVNVEWNYFCTTSKIVKNSISIQMIGVLIGSVIFGQASDWFGRKMSLNICTIGMMIGWLFVANSGNIDEFTVTRTIVGFFTGGSISVLNVFINEIIPKRLRITINMAITWSPNMPLLAFVAWLSHEWHSFAYWNAALCIPPLVFSCLCINESPRWLITKGKLSEAREIFRRQFKTSKQLDFMDEQFEDVLQTESVQSNRSQQQLTYYHLFSSWRLAMYTIVISFSYCATSVINYGILFNMEKLSGSIYMNSVYTGLMRYVCNISFAYAEFKINWVGRKFIHTSGLVVIIVSLVLVVSTYIFNVNHDFKDEIRVAILLASSMTSQVYIASGIVGNELFPTPVRNVGYSFVQVWNRVGVIISPFIFYLADYWIPLPFCVMIIISLIDTIAFECALPETKGLPMVEQMPSDQDSLLSRFRRRDVAQPVSVIDPPVITS